MNDPTWRPSSSESFAADVAKVEAKLAERARNDPAIFAAFVLRDEETGAPIEMAPFHAEWQDLCSSCGRLLLWAAVEHGKTQQITIARVLWEIGRNPRIRVAIMSATEGQAQKIVSTIGRYILESREFHMVFPHVRPSTRHGEAWTGTKLTVDRAGQLNEPTVQAVGEKTTIHGARIDLGVIDDLNNYANTATDSLREEVWKRLHGQLMNRVTRRGRLWFLGNAWHRRDVMHRMEGRPGYFARRYPAHSKATGAFAWPRRFDLAWLEQKRIDLGAPSNFRRMVYCELDEAEGKKIQWEWIQRALNLGHGKKVVHSLDAIPPGFSIYSGVDVAVGESEDADNAAIATISVDGFRRRRVLDIEGGRWGGPGLLDRMYHVHRRYGGIFVVENNGVQAFVKQFAGRDPRGPLPIIPYRTGTQKADPRFGIEALGVEFSNGMWTIPNKAGSVESDGLQRFVDQFDSYSPTSHTGDELMAVWLAREGAERGNRKGESGTLDTTTR